METKKILGVAALAVAAAISLYYLLQPVPVEQEEKPQIKRPASPPKPRQQKVVELPPEPQVRTARLTLSEYVSCIQKINSLLVKRLKALKQEFNQSRRANQDNPEEYSKLVASYKASERTLWQSVCSEVIQQENFPSDLYDDAHNEFMNKMEVVSEKENLKKGLTYGVVPEGITEERVKEILEFEVRLLADAHSVEDLIQNAETIARVEDRIFENYGIEVEDLRAASQLYQDKLKPLIRQILRNYSRFKV